MTRLEKLKAVANAYERARRDDGTEYTRIKDGPISEDMKHIQFALNEEMGTFELDYSIMDDACMVISENCSTVEELGALDEYEAANDIASVYTGERLSYLCIANDAEVAEIITEYSLDSVGTGAAIWYDKQVQQAVRLIKAWILEEDNA